MTISDAHDTFRNELASVARDGRRRWIYARQPSGRYYRARTALSILLVGFLFLAPFITIRGQPLMLLNVIERQFVLLGVLFRPQDFYLVVLLALTALVTLVLSTVLFGRIWCGWLCPQTVFMEMIFRRLEFAIEGSAERQLRRDRGPWTRSTLLRKGTKHAIFFGLSFLIANVFLAWVIGADALRVIVTDPPREHLAGLASILLFSFVFYMVFARFREQACVLACPYGRMMSALTDARTVTVTYDTRRGEPRGRLIRRAAPDNSQPPTPNSQVVPLGRLGSSSRQHPGSADVHRLVSNHAPLGVGRCPPKLVAQPSGTISPGEASPRRVSPAAHAKTGESEVGGWELGVDTDAAQGDCVDCHQCVTVCPTGIDIRNGIQLECINCTACMDACDGVMRRVGRPTGLIRLASHEAVLQGRGRRLTGRAAAYATVWLVLAASVTVLLASRRDLDVLILRQPGTLYTPVAGGDVANFYDVQVFNRTGRGTTFTIDVVEPAGATLATIGSFSEVGPYGLLEGRLVLRLPPAALSGPSTPVRFAVRTDAGAVQTIESAFLGPAGR